MAGPTRMKSFPISFSRHEAALIAITMVWGATFLTVQWAMHYSGALFFVGIRFLVAGGMTMLVFAGAMKGLTRRELYAGTAIGAALFLGYALQSHGLKTITSSQSAFITALYVPLVPLLQWLVLRRPPRLMSWVGIALAFAGLVLLAGPDAGRFTLSAGEIVTLLSALAIAAEIILIGSRRRGDVADGDAAGGGGGAGLSLGVGFLRGRAGRCQRADPADHELGAEGRLADARDADLCRRAGVGRHLRPPRRRPAAAAGPPRRRADRRRRYRRRMAPAPLERLDRFTETA